MTDNTSNSDPSSNVPLGSSNVTPPSDNQNPMTNTSNSDPSSDIPLASSNVTPPTSNQTPRRKRTKTANKETTSSSSKPKPVKTPDPDAPSTPHPCTECGRQFSSMKALFGHMRCHPERQWRGINPPPNFKRDTTNPPPNPTSSSLVSGASEEDQVASCLLMMASGSGSTASTEVEGRFECGGCKQVFASQQALGEHRETNKHVQGCSAITNVTEDPPPPQEIVDPPPQDKKKSVKLVSGLIHRCNICSREFLSGQALGGHMRCHYEKDQKDNQDQAIDLNVPASTSSDTSLDLNLRL